MVAELWHDVRFAARSLRRTWGFTITAIATLACGLALTAATLAVVNAYLLRAMPYPDAHRIYHLNYAPPGPYEPRGMNAIDWKALNAVVDATIIAAGETFYLPGAGYAPSVTGSRVSPGYITGLGVRPAIGRVFTDDEYKAGAEGVIIIGQSLWQERFGADPQVVGRRLEVRPEDPSAPAQSLRVVGVLPPGFWFGRDSSAKTEFIVPLRAPAKPYMVRLREGVPVALAEQRLTAAARAVGSDFRENWTGLHLESIHARYVATVRPVLVGITIAAGLLLALVGANIAVLILLRGMRRQKEVAVRIALGAERRHLARMLAAETGLICAGAAVLALALTTLALRVLAPLIETHLGRASPHGTAAIAVDSTVMLLIAAAGLVLVMLLSFLPLLAPGQRGFGEALRREGLSGTDGPFMRRLRATLIATEIAGSFVLLVGCGLMLRSAINIMRTDLGYRPEHVVRVRIVLPNGAYPDSAAMHGFYQRLLERVGAETTVPVTLSGSFPPFYDRFQQPLETEEALNSEKAVATVQVGAGHFGIMGIEVAQGRDFTRADRLGSEPVAVISETLARRLWPPGTAVGRRIRTGPQPVSGEVVLAWRTVVGVVRDVRQTYADQDLRDVYLPFLQEPTRFSVLEVRSERPPEYWLDLVRAAVTRIDPFVRVPSATTFVSLDRQRASTNFVTSVLSLFAALAAALAVLGIYGVTSYAAQQREREVAIRMALGAPANAVVRLFLRDAGWVIAAGIVLGVAGSLGAAKILANQVHGVHAFDPLTLAVMGIFLTCAGVIATWWPARRASRKDPILVLKEG
ncbi:MAG TPA: ABC transporter permease [Opitutaceae bacterium]|nr:ABC transporter permease [Opitutaceae bacterium]